jgi:hypothetical protein
MDTPDFARDSNRVECPETEELAALASPAVESGRRAALIGHAADCAMCREALAALAGVARSSRAEDGPATTTRDDAGTGDAQARAAAEALALAGDRRAAAALTAAVEARIGRYQLLDLAGAGGMGVVWSAWDPELARRVAIKRLHLRSEAARERILAEGQSLARLSHPNVVPVYDVGVVDGQVHLVMEWVEGVTLRAYAAGRSRREIVAAYREAGEGLAAAHRAGLVHRDFKPDNAIHGVDGRTRVLDFGLACDDEAGDAPPPGPRRVAGTPRYMAPEQAAGAPVTPAADQYAFARALEEALGGRARLPGWLARPLARATAPAPAARYPTMAALLAALGRDPAWRGRRAAMVAGMVAAAAGAFVLGRARPGTDVCTGSAAALAEIWSPQARVGIADHLHGLSAFGAAQVPRLVEQIDGYAAGWIREHQHACGAHDRGELPGALYERRLACLARARGALEATTALMAKVPADGLAAALTAARELPSPAGCAGDDDSPVAPPPAGAQPMVAAVAPLVARAQVLAAAARPEAADVAERTLAAAQDTGYAPLIARAALARGRAAVELGEGEPVARAALARAVDMALRASDDELAVEAYARLIYAVGRQGGDTVDAWTTMEAIAARTGARGRLGRALLYNNKAAARLAEDDRDGARELLRRAAEAAPDGPRGDGDIELVAIPFNLALVAGSPGEREAAAGAALQSTEALLGPTHPDALRARVLLATLTRDPAAAAALLDAACAGYARWHPERAATQAACWYERGWLAETRGDRAAARAAMTRAAAVAPAASHLSAIAAGYLAAIGDAEFSGAARDLTAIATADAASHAWWQRGQAAQARAALAIGWDRRGDPRGERAWADALALLDGVRAPLFARLRAHVQAVLADRWRASRPDEARRLAAAAVGEPVEIEHGPGADRAVVDPPVQTGGR